MKYSLRYAFYNAVNKAFNIKKKNIPEVETMLEEIKLANGINFVVTKEENGDWMAESTNIEGILTGGSSSDNIDDMIKDAIFTYYGIDSKDCVLDSIPISRQGEKVTRQEVVMA